MKFKLPRRKRLISAKTKAKNWEHVREYQRKYMKKYRATRRGQAIVQKANSAYVDRNRGALNMYNALTRYMSKDRSFRPRQGPKRTRVFGLVPWRIR